MKKFNKNKKGLEMMSELGIAILAMALFMVLLMFTVGFFDVAKESQKVEECKLSVTVNSKVKATVDVANMMSSGLQGDLPIKCVAPRVEISGDKIADQGLMIAEEMRKCWYKMGEGDLEVFGRESSLFKAAGDALKTAGNYYFGISGLKKPPAYCLVCSEFKIKEDNFQINELVKVLKTEKVDDVKTYSEYLSTWSMGPDKNFFYTYDVGANRFKRLSGNIKPSTDYLVVFLRYPETMVEKFSDVYEKTGNPGDKLSNEAQGIMVIAKSQLSQSNVCQKLYWEREKK